MAAAERGIKIRGPDDIEKIPGHSEKEFARLLVDGGRKPHLSVSYEAETFHSNNGDKVEGTLPDFRIENTRTGRIIYVEITTMRRNGEKDVKEKQRRVMSTQEGVLYVVLYRDNLEKIQRKHPEYNFFNGNKANKGS